MIRSISATIGEISRLLIFLSCLSLMATTLNADVLTTYEIQNATFRQGGTLEGSFVYDATTEEITDYHFMTTADGFFFLGDLEWIPFDTPPFGDNHELTARLGFSTLVLNYSDLNSPGGQEDFTATMTPEVGRSDFADGVAIATPEPGTIPILLFGALGLIGVRQWRRTLQLLQAHSG